MQIYSNLLYFKGENKMEKQIVKHFFGIVNEVRLVNSEIYYTTVYALSELEKYFKVGISDRYIVNILTDAFYYEYEDGANLLEVADKVVKYICEGYKTVDDFIDDMKVKSNPQEFIRYKIGSLSIYDNIEDEPLN